MVGRILVVANCRIKPSLLVHVRDISRPKLGCLPTHTRVTSHSSLQSLSTLTHPQYSYYNSQQYHQTASVLGHPTSHVKQHPCTPSRASLIVCWRCASSVGPPPGEEAGWLKQRWIKFKTIIKAFVAGSKELYGDVKKMRQIQSKCKGRNMVLGQPPKDGQLQDFPLTREELFFVTKTKKDLWRMLPTVTLFWIPFLGYFVPLVAFMFPHIFLTPHFLTEEQKRELTASKHQKFLAKTNAFSDALKKRGDSEQLTFLYKASDMFTSGQISDDLILTANNRGSPTLKNANMSELLGVWGIRSWIPFAAARQRRRLTDQMRYIYTSDWLMRQEGGVEGLSQEALTEVCCERRLDVDLGSSEDMRKKLNVWMRISTSFEAECPESVLAHLPAAQYLHDRTIKQ